MQEQINNLERTQKEQGDVLNKIYNNLVGDEFNEGIVSEVRKNSKHRNGSAKTHGFIAGGSVVLGGLLGKFWDHVIGVF